MKFFPILFLLAHAGMPFAAAGDATLVTPFSTAVPGLALPPPWRFATLPGIKNHTRYTLVNDGQSVVLRADAAASMASIVHPLKLDAGRFPIVSWRWKISNVLRNSDIRTRAGDDFPARVYVLFDYDTRKLPVIQRMKLAIARKRYGADVPTAALCYVWDGKAAAGTSAWSAYSDRVRMIVVEGGSGNLDRWRSEERDVAADFRAAFGEEPPEVSGVAIVSDTDNTGESATAMFGDINFRAAPK